MATTGNELDVKRQWRQLFSAYDKGQFALALLRCRKFLAHETDHYPTWIVLGSSYTKMHRYADAEKALTTALERAPKKGKYLSSLNLGHLEEARGQLTLALKWYRRAARIRPNEASAWVYCGHISFAQGKLKQAEKFNRRALQCEGGAIEEAWFNLGGALLAQDRLEEARECYVKAIAIDPKYGIAKKRLMDVELAIAERAQDAPKPPHPRKSRRAAAKTPTNAVRARSRSR